jgi:hypothetical protein
MAHLDFIDPGNSGGSVPTQDSPFSNVGFSVVTYLCSICGSLFDSQDALFEHRFQNHPFKRPALMLGGIEITSPRQLIVKQLKSDEIAFANVIRCFVNGALVEAKYLVEMLATKRCGLCNIVLENDGVKSSYQLDFDVSEDAELKSVEQVFFEVFGSGILDLGRIDLFIDMTAKFKSTQRYVDGLSHYLYGILAKDQRGGTQLDHSDYNTKFNQALDILRLFDRHLAKTIVGVVNFNQNVFDFSDGLFAAPKAQIAMLRFHSFMTGLVNTNKYLIPNTSVGLRQIPLDFSTEKIYEWSLMSIDELLRERKDLEHSLKSQSWVANDKFKVQMLLAELLVAIEEFPAAIRIAGSLSNDTVFGPWAQRILEKKI